MNASHSKVIVGAVATRKALMKRACIAVSLTLLVIFFNAFDVCAGVQTPLGKLPDLLLYEEGDFKVSTLVAKQTGAEEVADYAMLNQPLKDAYERWQQEMHKVFEVYHALGEVSKAIQTIQEVGSKLPDPEIWSMTAYDTPDEDDKAIIEKSVDIQMQGADIQTLPQTLRLTIETLSTPPVLNTRFFRCAQRGKPMLLEGALFFNEAMVWIEKAWTIDQIGENIAAVLETFSPKIEISLLQQKTRRGRLRPFYKLHMQLIDDAAGDIFIRDNRQNRLLKALGLGKRPQTLAALAGSDAVFFINGWRRTSASNTVKDVRPGISLMLKNTFSGECTIKIRNDTALIQGLLLQFARCMAEYEKKLQEDAKTPTTYHPQGILWHYPEVHEVSDAMKNLILGPSAEGKKSLWGLKKLLGTVVFDEDMFRQDEDAFDNMRVFFCTPYDAHNVYVQNFAFLLTCARNTQTTLQEKVLACEEQMRALQERALKQNEKTAEKKEKNRMQKRQLEAQAREHAMLQKMQERLNRSMWGKQDGDAW